MDAGVRMNPPHHLTLSVALFATVVSFAPAQAPLDLAWVDARIERLEAFYQELHQSPELSFHEKATAARLAKELRQAGLTVTEGVGGEGIVAVLKNGAGPTVLFRADLDGLPIAEETGLPYASKIRATANGGQAIGVMHACGHDLHMTNLLGTAQWFAENQAAWRGTLVCIGQPAEERSGGAKAMLKDGLFERFPKPDFAFALHCEPMLAAGMIGYRSGPLMAAVDSVDVTIRGRGGHGAAPHRTIDPIVIASQYVLALQTIVSREIDPIQSAVITVGAIQGGHKHNIIPDRCELQLTVRSYDEGVRSHLKDAIVRKAKALAMAAGAPEPEVRFSEPTGALKNDKRLTEQAAAAMQRALGTDKVIEVNPQMIAEDFGQFGDAGVPICMFRVGTTETERLQKLLLGNGPPGLHTAGFYPDFRPSIRASIVASVEAGRAVLARP